MFFFADDEYWTWRSAHNALGGAADAQMSPTSITMCGDDDEIDVEFLGGLRDLVRRMPDAHKRSD